MLTAIRDTDGVGSPQEVLCDWHDLSTVGDGDWTFIAVRVVVAWLLVVFEPLHEGHEV